MTDADTIRDLLTIAGLSQHAAARELGIDERALRRYCAGDMAVPPYVIFAVRAFAIWELFDQSEHKSETREECMEKVLKVAKAAELQTTQRREWTGRGEQIPTEIRARVLARMAR